MKQGDPLMEEIVATTYLTRKMPSTQKLGPNCNSLEEGNNNDNCSSKKVVAMIVASAKKWQRRRLKKNCSRKKKEEEGIPLTLLGTETISCSC